MAPKVWSPPLAAARIPALKSANQFQNGIVLSFGGFSTSLASSVCICLSTRSSVLLPVFANGTGFVVGTTSEPSRLGLTELRTGLPSFKEASKLGFSASVKRFGINSNSVSAETGCGSGSGSGSIVSAETASSSGSIVSFGLTSGTDTTIHSGCAAYTYGTINLGSDYIFSDSSLSSSTTIGSGSGGAITVIISPKEGHGDSAIKELGGHYVMTATTLTQAEGDDISTANDFREVGMVVDPTTYGTSTVASATTVRLTNAVKLSSSSGTFDVDEKISNAAGAIGKVVEWDSTNSIIYYHQERYGDYGTNSTTGAFTTFSGTGTITGATSGATGTPSSSSSETVTLANNNTLSFTSGYANPELQPDSGNIVYTENRKPIQRASDQTEDIKLIIEF